MIDWNNLSDDQLENMYEAAQIVIETTRVVQKSGSNIVAELMKEVDEFLEWNHLPPGDVYDSQSHSQYYYHAHPKSDDGTDIHDDEHGHFHFFMRGPGMPDKCRPKKLADLKNNMAAKDILTHFIGISMDIKARPIRLFTVNRWVTGEVWFDADDVIEMLDLFEIDHIKPSWPVNLWVTNMIRLYRPVIQDLIRRRDATINAWRIANSTRDNIYEDRNLEVTSATDIDVMAYVSAMEDEIDRRGL